MIICKNENVENVMGGRFSIKLQLQIRFCTLKTMFEFAFMQMAKTNMQSCNKFDLSKNFTIKSTIGDWPDNF